MNEDAEEEAEWNFRERYACTTIFHRDVANNTFYSFDHSSNGPMNTKMLANIEGLQTDVRWPVVTIKRKPCMNACTSLVLQLILTL